MLQCVIYDSDKPDARLIGIEYIISAKLFETLPPEEKELWHSHVHEVKSGQLIAPRLPDVAEKELMEKLVGTYGKTWHTWQVDRGDKLPLGIPQLMMGFTADGQANPELVAERDKAYGISSDEKRKNRADIPSPAILPGADAWQQGKALQLDIRPREHSAASAAIIANETSPAANVSANAAFVCKPATKLLTYRRILEDGRFSTIQFIYLLYVTMILGSTLPVTCIE